ncbi:MAG: hypothetical protein RBR68_15045 [Tenuifilaceae bacterium]|nr:hypothetical protein [Tenuifilaceae bacterium]
MAQVERATSVGGKQYLTQLLSVFQFSNTIGVNGVGQIGAFNSLGFSLDFTLGTYVQDFLQIQAFIPDNFTIISAFITMHHTSSYIDTTAIGGSGAEWCYARKVQAYTTNITDRYVYGDAFSEYFEDGTTNTLITNSFGENGFTATPPTGGIPPSTPATEKVVSIDIKSSLQPGLNLIKVASSDTLPTSELVAMRKSGQAAATLTVIGYQN